MAEALEILVGLFVLSQAIGLVMGAIMFVAAVVYGVARTVWDLWLAE